MYILRPFPVEACCTKCSGRDKVCTITWPSGRQGPLIVVVQDHSQTHRVGGKDGAAEVHARQALRLSLRAIHGLLWAVPSSGLPFLAFTPGSQHDMNDALLIQVTALGGSEGETDEKVQALKHK